MKKNVFLILLFFTNIIQTFSQEKYWLVFKDKDNFQKPAISEKAIENRKRNKQEVYQWTDLPIKAQYLAELAKREIYPVNKSRWFNSVSVLLNHDQLSTVRQLPFIKEIVSINKHYLVTNSIGEPETDLRVDMALNQVGISYFLADSLTAKGITIGVIDAGYYGAKDAVSLKHLFAKDAILGIKDFVNPSKKEHFTKKESNSDFHGTEVLNAIAGKNERENIQFGLATDAKFYLTRTDSGNKEFRGEEDNWIAAVEWLDSLGVRIINTSLGYTKGFTNPAENYKPSDMNGSTSLIARAAKMAVDQKGLLLVVSAGNEGDDKNWRIISTPADVDGVLAVGATQENGLKIGYSSIGPEFLNYTKPDVACYSLFGTSLAAPIITGFMACLMEANGELPNKQLIDIIKKSSSLYPYSNNYLGNGIPNAGRALTLLKGKEDDKVVKIIEVDSTQNEVEINLEYVSNEMSVFYKKNDTIVLSQEHLDLKSPNFVMKRNPAIKETTLATKQEVIEVKWQDKKLP